MTDQQREQPGDTFGSEANRGTESKRGVESSRGADGSRGEDATRDLRGSGAATDYTSGTSAGGSADNDGGTSDDYITDQGDMGGESEKPPHDRSDDSF